MDSPSPSRRLDAHQHFWIYDPQAYPWIPPGSPLQCDRLPPELEALQAPLGFVGSVAVQAQHTLEEARWLLGLADRAPQIRGVVGWADLQSEQVEEQLAELARHSKFVGVRHAVQDEPDPRFLLRPEFMRGIAKLRSFGLTYDLLILAHQLPAAIELVGQFPEQPFVLDHLAKPGIREHALEPWRRDLCALAKLPNIHCKLSGLVTEADPAAWQAEDFRPYLETAFEAFGAERLMFGSDWPVCLLAASYEEVLGLITEYTAPLSAEAKAGIFGENAARFYSIA